MIQLNLFAFWISMQVQKTQQRNLPGWQMRQEICSFFAFPTTFAISTSPTPCLWPTLSRCQVLNCICVTPILCTDGAGWTYLHVFGSYSRPVWQFCICVFVFVWCPYMCVCVMPSPYVPYVYRQCWTYLHVFGSHFRPVSCEAISALSSRPHCHICNTFLHIYISVCVCLNMHLYFDWCFICACVCIVLYGGRGCLGWCHIGLYAIAYGGSRNAHDAGGQWCGAKL